MEQSTWSIAAFTALMGILSTLVALPLGILAAWVLARRTFPGKAVLETLLSLPLVMPPVAAVSSSCNSSDSTASWDGRWTRSAWRSCSPGRRWSSRWR
ncbi:MAG: hypothetical protein R2712_09940 [Vicinamibacterales bacterium]